MVAIVPACGSSEPLDAIGAPEDASHNAPSDASGDAHSERDALSEVADASDATEDGPEHGDAGADGSEGVDSSDTGAPDTSSGAPDTGVDADGGTEADSSDTGIPDTRDDGDGSPTVSCNETCHVQGALRCAGQSIEMCTMLSGCPTWASLANCSAGQLCCDGVCVEPDEANCFACGLVCTGNTPSCSRTEQRCACRSATCDGGVPDAPVDASLDGDSAATTCPQPTCPGSSCVSANCPLAYCLADCALQWRDCSAWTWPSGQIVFKPIGDASLVAKFKAAAAIWTYESGGTVSFTQDDADARSDALRVYPDAPNGTGECTIGHPSAPECHWSPTMSDAMAVHSLGHVIGLFNQEVRADRDTYVQIMPDSFACSLDSRNFEDHWWKCSSGTDGTGQGNGFGVYSMDSIMQTPSTNRVPIKHRSDCKKDVDEPGTFPTAKDGSDVRELYAWPSYQWRQFVSMSPVTGADRTRRITIASPPASTTDVRVLGAPALAANGVDLDAYVRGTDMNLYRRTRGTDGTWPDRYENLGGPLESDPSADSWGPGTWLVVAVRNSTVQIRVFANDAWQPWLPNIATIPNGMAPGSAVAIGTTSPGMLEVGVFDVNRRVLMTTFQADPPYTNGAWSTRGWSYIPTELPAGIQLSAGPALSPQGDGTLSVVVVTTGGHVYHIWRDVSTPDNQRWNPFWEDIGAGADPSVRPTATSWGWGRMDAFYRGADGQVWWTYWDRFTVGWSGYKPIGGLVATSPAAAAARGSTRIDLIAIGTDGGLWHRWR